MDRSAPLVKSTAERLIVRYFGAMGFSSVYMSRSRGTTKIGSKSMIKNKKAFPYPSVGFRDPIVTQSKHQFTVTSGR
jgi:hypothetical protein